jgi:hypothetical protein
MRKLRRVGSGEDDPLDGVANFFDLGVIFALGFMVPLMIRLAAPTSQQLANAQSPTASEQVQHQTTIPLQGYKPSTDRLGGEGERLGVAYRLKSGEVVYVPESSPQRP